MPRPTLVLLLIAAGCGTSWEAIDADGDGFTRKDGDCWDAVEGPAGLAGADIHPDATETFYDGVDQDCDGRDDYDADADGYVPDEYAGLATTGAAGSGALPAGDCWDEPTGPEGSELGGADIHPDASETFYDGVDQDCDGLSDYDADYDGHDHADHDGTDCDDEDATVNPDAAEVWYNGVDENCDTNDGDQDGDGYWAEDYEDLVAGNGGEPLEVPKGYDGDCDDEDAAAYPGADETWYDGVDQACDGGSDYDADGDTYDAIDHGGDDCDDDDDAVNPEAFETYYDGIDQDCDGESDYDADRDGHDAEHYGGDDCDDTDAAISPSAAEIFYDGTDQDCDDASDYDADADGHDSSDYSGDDCDDSDATVNPSALETWYDGVDQDCDELSDYDADYDGYDSADYAGQDCDDTRSDVYPEADEAWDATDNDCDGLVDDMDPADAAVGWLDGGSSGDQLGFGGAVSTGDVDGDGADEIIVGSLTAAADMGTVWVVDLSLPRSLHGPASGYANPSVNGGVAGAMMAALGPIQGDVTGDGVADLVVGGTDATDSSASALAVYTGGSSLVGVLTPSSATLELTGVEGADAPTLLSHLDMNGDGIAEILHADWSGVGSWGYTGSPLYLIEPASLSGSMDISSAASDYLFAWSSDDQPGRVMGGGDVDGDGYDDLVLGAPGNDSDSGLIAMYLGSSPLPSWSGWSDYEDHADLTVTGDAGSRLGEAGRPLVMDFDGDLTEDLIIATPSSDTVYVYLDVAALVGSELGLADADLQMVGETGSRFGAALEQGDVTGDSVVDLMVGAPGSDDADAPSSSWSGAAYLFDGALIGGESSITTADASWTLLPDQADLLGAALLAVDFDGDAVVDPVVVAPAHDGSGRAWLLPSP